MQVSVHAHPLQWVSPMLPSASGNLTCYSNCVSLARVKHEIPASERCWLLLPAFALLLLAPHVVSAQSTFYLSNYDYVGGGGDGLGSDHWKAQSFRTGSGAGAYRLDSVRLLVGTSGNPGNTFLVSIYTDVAGLPGDSLSPLSGPFPTFRTTDAFTAPGLDLAPATTYWIVATASIPAGDDYFYWGGADSTNYVSRGEWTIDIASGKARWDTGTGWSLGLDRPYLFAVEATPVPEPKTLVLATLMLACLRFWSRREPTDFVKNRSIVLWTKKFLAWLATVLLLTAVTIHAIDPRQHFRLCANTYS